MPDKIWLSMKRELFHTLGLQETGAFIVLQTHAIGMLEWSNAFVAVIRVSTNATVCLMFMLLYWTDWHYLSLQLIFLKVNDFQ